MNVSAIPEFLVALDDAFNAAMVSNDVDRIAPLVTEDWILVTPEIGPLSRERLFDAIRTGELSHSSMTKHATHAGVYGDVAWITGRGQNTGAFRGTPFEADEYVTDVYHRVDGVWRCVLTHLTPAQK